MLMRRATVLGIGGMLVLSGGQLAWATIDNLKSFKQAYPGKDPKFYSCKVCHNSVIGKKGDLNAYGLALQKSKAPADAKELTKQDFRAIEKGDADGDGVSNLDEITAGTAPGDPLSVPKSATPQVSTKTSSQESPKAQSDETAIPTSGVGWQKSGAEPHKKEVKP